MTPTYKRYLNLIEQFPLVLITSNDLYEQAKSVASNLENIHRLERLTVEELEYLDVLKHLIEVYEDRAISKVFPTVDPLQALQRLMREHGLTQSDIIEISGEYKTNVSAFLSGTRNISRSVAQKLAERFNVSPDLFMQKMPMTPRATVYCSGGMLNGLFVVKLVLENLNPKLSKGSYELEPYTYKAPFPPYYPVFIWLPAENTNTENYSELATEVALTYDELISKTYETELKVKRKEQRETLLARLSALSAS